LAFAVRATGAALAATCVWHAGAAGAPRVASEARLTRGRLVPRGEANSTGVAFSTRAARNQRLPARQKRRSLVVAGRLFAQLGTAVGALPVDASVWNNTALTVPARFAGATLTDVLGAAKVTVGNEPRVADAWRGFPGAVLYGMVPAP